MADSTDGPPVLVEATRKRRPDHGGERGRERMGVWMLEIPLPIRLMREFRLSRLRLPEMVIIDALPIGLPRGRNERLPGRDGRVGILQERRHRALNAIVGEAITTDFEIRLFVEHDVTGL